MSFKQKLWFWLRKLLFPGLDLNTRSRVRWLAGKFLGGNLKTLDAGCGNGALAYEAYKKGNNVLGITFEEVLAKKNHDFFSYRTGGDPKIQFKTLNLYDLGQLDMKFDQIICSETLEHIKDDKKIIQYFAKLLKSGGTLHLCCPNRLHPHHNMGRVDCPEDGGHVRDGYTLGDYQDLLESRGFQIQESVNVGSTFLANLNGVLSRIRASLGDFLALPVFFLLWPIAALMDRPGNRTPFSVYVCAKKNDG